MAECPCASAFLPMRSGGKDSIVAMMRVVGILIVVLGLVLVLLLLRLIWRSRGHVAALRSRPFPEQWREILRRRVPLYRRLPNEQRGVLERHIARFLVAKSFEACGDLETVTDEMRLTAAGNACLLLAGRPGGEPFASLRSILLYPTGFTAPGQYEGEAHRGLLGESWDTGSVILSWETMQEDAAAGADGFNVVLHEFAHQLDQEFGHADGLPLLDHSGQYSRWAAAFSEAFKNHRRTSALGRRTAIDPYGAESAAEFFACATETFFERPEDLRREIRPIFDQLAAYYRVDPTSWT